RADCPSDPPPADRLVAEAPPAQPRRPRAGLGARDAVRHRHVRCDRDLRRHLRGRRDRSRLSLLGVPRGTPDVLQITARGGTTMTTGAKVASRPTFRRLLVTLGVAGSLLIAGAT